MREPPSREVQEYLEQLLLNFKVCHPIDHKVLQELLNNNDLVEVVRRVRNHMKVPIRIIVRTTENEWEGPPKCPAWIRINKNFPLYGTDEFKRATVEMFFRKSFVVSAPGEAIIKTIAHEMSHIVLNSLWHPLKNQEKAVDITAMILGYRELYLKAWGNRFVLSQMTLGQKVLCWIWSAFTLFRKRYGVTGVVGAYLSRDEIVYVNHTLEELEKVNKILGQKAAQK